jgi:hypothetical protein
LRQIAVSCSSCHRVLKDLETLYTEHGDPICETCSQKGQARASLDKSADATRGMALGNPLLGIASFFFDPFFICSLGSIGNGIYCLRRTRADARRGEGSRNSRGPQIAAALGMAVGAASLLFRVFR